MSIRKFSIAAALGAVIAIVGLAPAANAANQDATINNNEFVFFYNSNYGGSYSDFTTKKSNLAGYRFIKPGWRGYTQAVKNNSASVANFKGRSARVYFNSNYVGTNGYDTVPAESLRNLVATYNENASFQWL